MKEKDVLDLEIRNKIYNAIHLSPGMHERQLSRILNIPLSTLKYHLNYLEKKQLILIKYDGHYARYYVIGKHSQLDKIVLGILRQSASRKIILFLLSNPDSHHKDICNHLKLARSTTTFHLNNLLKLGIITKKQSGRNTIFNIRDKDHIIRLLISYRDSFFDKTIDKFIDTFLDLNPKYQKEI